MRATHTIRLRHDTHRDLRAFATFHCLTMDEAVWAIGVGLEIEIIAVRSFFEEHAEFLERPFPCVDFLRPTLDSRPGRPELQLESSRALNRVKLHDETYRQLQAFSKRYDVTMDRAVRNLMVNYVERQPPVFRPEPMC